MDQILMILMISMNIWAQTPSLGNHFTMVPTIPDPSLMFPFYGGEFLSPSIDGFSNLNIQYQLPADTYFNILNPPGGLQNYVSDQLYNLQVTGLPPSVTPYDYSSFMKNNFWVSGATISKNSTPSRTSKYKYRRRLTKPTTVTRTVKISHPVSPTEGQSNTDCKNNNCPKGNLATSLNLATIKKEILRDNKVPLKAFNSAWDFFTKNYEKIKNKDFITVVDYNLPDDVPRLFLINLKTLEVKPSKVAHGVNSNEFYKDKKYAVNYSNASGSKQSSVGAYITSETYTGGYGNSLNLIGMESTNSNALTRRIVAHKWDFKKISDQGKFDKNGKYTQDTDGCFGLPRDVYETVINGTKNGSLWYVHPMDPERQTCIKEYRPNCSI